MQIKNWKPISLINVDMKITSNSLAFRMNKVLPSIFTMINCIREIYKGVSKVN